MAQSNSSSRTKRVKTPLYSRGNTSQVKVNATDEVVEQILQLLRTKRESFASMGANLAATLTNVGKIHVIQLLEAAFQCRYPLVTGLILKAALRWFQELTRYEQRAVATRLSPQLLELFLKPGLLDEDEEFLGSALGDLLFHQHKLRFRIAEQLLADNRLRQKLVSFLSFNEVASERFAIAVLEIALSGPRKLDYQGALTETLPKIAMNLWRGLFPYGTIRLEKLLAHKNQKLAKLAVRWLTSEINHPDSTIWQLVGVRVACGRTDNLDELSKVIASLPKASRVPLERKMEALMTA